MDVPGDYALRSASGALVRVRATDFGAPRVLLADNFTVARTAAPATDPPTQPGASVVGMWAPSACAQVGQPAGLALPPGCMLTTAGPAVPVFADHTITSLLDDSLHQVSQ